MVAYNKKRANFGTCAKSAGSGHRLSDNAARSSGHKAPGHHITGSFPLPFACSNSCTDLEMKLATQQAFLIAWIVT